MGETVLEIKVLGSGCAKCIKTASVIQQVARDLGVAANIEKVTDPEVFLAFNVMKTPAVVVNEKLVHSGSVPAERLVREWLG
jgi:small redox-active disulfide protein 2